MKSFVKVAGALSALALVGLSVLAVGCAAQAPAASPSEVATVQKGNITVAATASGNLAFSTQQDLAFETAGTVASVTVEEGDTVKEGQVLATLDTQQWQDNVTAKERSLLQAKMDLKNAEVALDQVQNKYTWSDLFVVQADVDKARIAVDYDNTRLQQAAAGDKEAWAESLAEAESDLTTAQDILNAMLAAADTDQVAMKKTQVQLARLKVDDAQKALDDARAVSPVVKAPFAGLITKVNVLGGDDVKKGTIAVQVADPSQFQAVVLVSQKDVFQTKLGGDATVQIDAMPSVILPAKVIAVAPTATIQQGVVNYKVTVETQALQPGLAGSSGQGQSQKPSSAATTGQAMQLRAGLSATVSILIEQRNGVLLVPNRMIRRQDQNTVVTLLKNGVTELRTIKTGISDWQNTEVTEGLSEGDQVVLTRA